MIKRWKEWLRQQLLTYLRPGRDVDELLHLIDRAEAIHSEEQRRMLERIVDFNETRVREVMIPRLEIRAVDIGSSLEEAETIMLNSGVTRLPVMEGDIDRILGVVHVWDLFAVRAEGRHDTLKELIRPCLKVSELQRVPRLLSDMKEGSHIAIVLDEYGGTAGLITLSDLLEEIVGSLAESDESSDEAEFVRTDSGALEVMGRMHIEEFAELVGIAVPQGDFDTVAGLITTELGRIPVRGERILVADLDMNILDADPRRVIRILVRPTPLSSIDSRG